jgi:hypothetical protein
MLLAAVLMSLFWAVRYALALDLLAALASFGLSVFLGVLGLFWWFGGEQVQLDEQAEARWRSRRFWRRFRPFVRRR